MAYMPCIPLAVKLPETADLRQAARYLGAPGEPDEQTLALLRRCTPPLMAACRARAVYRQLSTADLAQAGLLHGCGWSHPPGGHRRCGRRSGNGCLGFCVGRAGRRCGGKAAGAALSGAGAVSDRALLSRIRGLALGYTAAAGQTAGYAPADRPLRAGKLPDDPPQKHHRPFGRGRTSGAGAPCRMRPLCFAGAL